MWSPVKIKQKNNAAYAVSLKKLRSVNDWLCMKNDYGKNQKWFNTNFFIKICNYWRGFVHRIIIRQWYMLFMHTNSFLYISFYSLLIHTFQNSLAGVIGKEQTKQI